MSERRVRGLTFLLWAVPAAVAVGLSYWAYTTMTRVEEPEDPLEAALRESEEELQEQQQRQERLGFDVGPPAIEPGAAENTPQLVKPGHWTVVSQQLQSDRRDFVGSSTDLVVDAEDQPLPLASTPFVLSCERPVVLSQGRPKQVATTLFVPQAGEEIMLSTAIREHGGFTLRQLPVRLVRMPAYQYHFVVLAKEPARYSFLKSLDSVTVPFDGLTDLDDTTDPLHYQVVQPDISRQIPLSDNPLTWSSTAYILWDEVDPQLFTPEQQDALVDWLYWGGQLIVSGPDSLDLLKGSFLETWLPATSSGSRTLTAADLAELDRGWTVSTGQVPGERLHRQVAWSGAALDVHADAQPLPSTGGLLVERSVGRGRIVVSAMQLSERELVNWRGGFESWFNACLLRRPPRVYRKGYFGGPTLFWADAALATRRLDPRLTTHLRYFSRDMGLEEADGRVEQVSEQRRRSGTTSSTMRQLASRDLRQASHDDGLREDIAGVGAWNRTDGVAGLARSAILGLTGVDVPGVSFVVAWLVVYLIVLVPLNWLVFHTLGRVEWAWIAAPAIAVAGALAVVHQAELDIGLVRSQTDIGVLELQPDHPRGHLTRFTSLYTSLTTSYTLESENLTTLATPIPTDVDFELLAGQGLAEVTFERHNDVRLAGVPVSSNSLGVIRSEQMFSPGGVLRLVRSKIDNRQRIENRTELDLRSVGIVQRPADRANSDDGELWGTWIDRLPPGESQTIALVPLPGVGDRTPFADQRRRPRGAARGDWLDLEPFFQLAYDWESFEPGEIRLVGRVDDLLPGQTITPAASQQRAATLVVAHLQYGPLPAPRPDLNTRLDVTSDGR